MKPRTNVRPGRLRVVVVLERLHLPRRELELLRDRVDRQPAASRAAAQERAGRGAPASARLASDASGCALVAAFGCYSQVPAGSLCASAESG